jgi:hypothetical protein
VEKARKPFSAMALAVIAVAGALWPSPMNGTGMYSAFPRLCQKNRGKILNGLMNKGVGNV